jgi:hypothetical protein
MDAAAPEQARQFYNEAKVTFVRGIDRSDGLWDSLDFQVVPNGIFLDEHGVVRYAKFGGFEARVAPDVAAIEGLLSAGPAPPPAALTVLPLSTPSPARQWFQRGLEALQKGDKAAAARHWRQALQADPKNFVIRKQIWALEHPEQFYPKINFEWQRRQLAEERGAEPRP